MALIRLRKKMQMSSQYGIFKAWANHAVFDIHIWTYIIELDYLEQMLDKVWVICVQFPHLCMCDKVNFSLHIIPFVKGFELIGVICLFYTFLQGGYRHIYIYDGSAGLYIYMWVCCVCVSLFILPVIRVHRLLFSNEVACAAPKTNWFPEQGSYSDCIDLIQYCSCIMGFN